MNKDYLVTKTTISYIKYHFIFCPRYRRKIFNISGVEQRFRELVGKECDSLNIDIISLYCSADYVYLHVSVLPTVSIVEIMKQIKGATSSHLRNEFVQLMSMPSLWTRNYYVSTEDEINDETILWYVELQKTRP